MKKQIVFFAIIFALTTIVSGCNKKDQGKSRMINEPEVASSDVGSDSWETYQNEELAFKIEYPKDAKKRENKSETRPSVVFESEKSHFEVKLISDFNVNLDNYSYLDFSPSGRGTINGHDTLIFKSEKGYCDGPSCGYPFIAFSTKVNDIFYNLTFFKITDLNEEARKILESFDIFTK